ncbi:hypothetical protein [Streptomyces sp. NPDC048720]|uniref:hypothetical protein n=1 Tax=Streptomyces sp. NPDC048720 TaxID=3365588 RepID=UPI00371D52D5
MVCRHKPTSMWAAEPFESRVGPWATQVTRPFVLEETYLEGKAEGEAEGEAKGVLRVLEVRGIPVSDDARKRITSCTDPDRVADWLDRAATVSRAEDLFAGDVAEQTES